MKIIFGASGHAKEIEFLLREESDGTKGPVDFFVSDVSNISIRSISVISEELLMEKLIYYNEETHAYVAIGSSHIREKIVHKFLERNNIYYPNLISKYASGDFDNIFLGSGNVLFPSVLMTTDIVAGDHNHFNLNTSISHDCVIGNYNTFSPSVRIAGKVTIGNHNFFGVGACVIDKISIADNIVVGAGAVVTKDLTVPGTYVGAPARKVK